MACHITPLSKGGYMLSVDGFLSAWDRTDWTLNFSFGDCATLIMGFGTLALAYVAIRLQKRQNRFVEMQTTLLKKQTAIQGTLSNIEKTKFEREEFLLKKKLESQILYYFHCLAFGLDFETDKISLYQDYSDKIDEFFDDELSNIIDDFFSIKTDIDIPKHGTTESDIERLHEDLKNKYFEIMHYLFDIEVVS